ncbi:MAG: dihydrodipicolinate synthase family protein [Syntrophales bacterium]
MTTLGLVHTPVTPFKEDQSIDYECYGRLIEFHLRHGADSLALPTPEGEDMSLTDQEQRDLLAFAIGRVKGRVPVIAHASDAGTALAVARAREAERLGAAAIVSHPPYFWHPKPAMVVEHLAAIGSTVGLPFYLYNPPVETAGTSLTGEMIQQLSQRLPNLAGIVDCSFSWEFLEEAVLNGRANHPDFRILSGAEFMVSTFILGGPGCGCFSPLTAIAPLRVRELYEHCLAEQYLEAREAQEDLAALHHAVKEAGFSGLKDGLAGIKAAMARMGRDCGLPRSPVSPLDEKRREKLLQQLTSLAFLKKEPKGW